MPKTKALVTRKAKALATTPRIIDAEFVEEKKPSATGFDFELAMRMYEKRKAESKGKQIDNSRLHAGSPMYYYCRFCGAHTETLPEGHFNRPTVVCDPCKILHDHGLI